MTLSEVYLLANDLSVLKERPLIALSASSTYVRRNTFKPSVLYFPARFILGAKVIRHGQYLALLFSTCTLVLKMAEQTSIVVCSKKTDRSDACLCLTFGTEASKLYLTYNDPLNCGYYAVYSAGEVPSVFSNLGVDVLSPALTAQYLMSEVIKLSHLNNRVSIKSFLMNNSAIAWIDNEVASEALFLAGLHPQLDVESGLSYANAMLLIKSLKLLYSRILEIARNDYCLTKKIPVSVLYSVFNREHLPCVLCGQPIKKLVIDNKPTYMCPKCQPLKKQEHAHV
jgi:formamidopyrimidine-DNA glycosylase